MSVLVARKAVLWIHLVKWDSPEVGERVRMFAARDPTLLKIKDSVGRTAINIATPENQAMMNSVLLWHGRQASFFMHRK